MLAPFLPPPIPPFQEKVEVRVVLHQVRVLDREGEPIRHLRPEHFQVWVAGEPVSLLAVRWVGAEEEAQRPISGESPSGRLVTFLVQRDLQKARASGLLAFKHRAAQLIERLPPQDWVALVVQDSRLHLFADYTRDHGQVAELMRLHLFRPPPRRSPSEAGPSLAAELPEAVQKKAATHEQGLLALAQALLRLPGTKVLVILGWGLGRLWAPSFYLPSQYLQAVHLLERAGIPVFSLDITDADYHTLELGLMQVAEDTGGFYAKTHLFPEQAVRRLWGALAGYYELAFLRPPLPEGVHPVEVKLVGVSGQLFYRPTFADPLPVGLP
ncbi:MAG: hypothetical protein NZ869_08795 [Thermoanaerobaculum sp.]|nr:hypothetical protein [Thermoanaerobaculum sp.]MDW7967802.1 hypothetical protein [Thermoanaerobaculum sp.]